MGARGQAADPLPREPSLRPVGRNQISSVYNSCLALMGEGSGDSPVRKSPVTDAQPWELCPYCVFSASTSTRDTTVFLFSCSYLQAHQSQLDQSPGLQTAEMACVPPP